MRTLCVVIVLLLSLSACASYSKPVPGPNGRTMLVVSCGWNETACYERAAKECPHGYRLDDASPLLRGSDARLLVECE